MANNHHAQPSVLIICMKVWDNVGANLPKPTRAGFKRDFLGPRIFSFSCLGEIERIGAVFAASLYSENIYRYSVFFVEHSAEITSIPDSEVPKDVY